MAVRRAERAEQPGGASASSPDGDGVPGRSPQGVAVRRAERAEQPAAGVDSGRAWVVAVTIAVCAALAFGICYSFGAFFDSMEEEFHAGRSATALVFAITTFLFFGVGIVSGPLSDRIGPRRLL